MLHSTIRNMEHVIEDLESKVSKAENRADSAEENCITLSESNAELNEETGFLGSRLESMEGFLHQEEEAKMTTAKGHWKVDQSFKINESHKKQLSSLASENKVLVVS